MKNILGFIFITILAFAFSKAARAEIQIDLPAPLILTQTLSVGSTGSEVSLLQEFLKTQNLFNYPTITGRFGLITKASVITFQKNNNLDWDGVVGPRTRAKIAELTTPKLGVALENHYVNPSPRDTKGPNVSITNPIDNSTVSGTITVSAVATDNKKVTGVRFQIDETSDLGSEDTTAPYSVILDTTELSEGVHSFRAIARDTAGNQTISASVGIIVSNTPLIDLDIFKSGAGLGVIQSSPAGVTCGGDCSHTYPQGTEVTLSANPDSGSTFTGWSGGGCVGTGTCVITLNSDTQVTATFGVITYTLTTNRTGGGTGLITSSPAGINCGSTCVAIFDNGTMVALTATPSMGSVFSGWSGGGCSGLGACVVSLTSAVTVTASFDPT